MLERKKELMCARKAKNFMRVEQINALRLNSFYLHGAPQAKFRLETNGKTQ
jgi:hypothetical protein